MTARQPLRIVVDDEFARLLALYTRTGETPRMALLKGLKTRAMADGLVGADGKPKLSGPQPGGRP